MSSSRPHTLVHGAIAGILAGLIVALWFLIVDMVTAEPLSTPALLASALLGASPPPGALLVISYTIIHLAVFAALGVGAAAVLRATNVAPGLLLGALFGLIVLNGVHYGALLLTGMNVLGVLPALHVLLANLVGGMVMMAYLHRAMRAETMLGIANVRSFPLLERGLVTGAIGAAAVAVWMLGADLMAARPFFTPAALGSLLFLGAQSPADVQISFGIVAAYTLLHLTVFALVGVGLEWAAARVERMPQLWFMALLAFFVLEALFLGTIGTVGLWVLDALGLFALVTANLVAITAMGTWLWLKHPRLRQAISTVSPVR